MGRFARKRIADTELSTSADSEFQDVLKNLPVFRWADLPVSLSSFGRSVYAARLVHLRCPHRRFRVTSNRSSSASMRAYQPARTPRSKRATARASGG
jgi:hypothetical protein